MFFSENVRNGAAFRCIEAVGQAIAYGMNTQTTSDPIIGLYVLSLFPFHLSFASTDSGYSSGVTFGLLGAALIPMIMLVNTTPDKIPADVVAEEQIAASEKLQVEGA